MRAQYPNVRSRWVQIMVIESPSGPGKGSVVSLERDINGAVHV